MGSALNSQVMFGEGFPVAAQVKRAEEPREASWLLRPSFRETGSVEERLKGQNQGSDPHLKHWTRLFSYRVHSQYS